MAKHQNKDGRSKTKAQRPRSSSSSVGGGGAVHASRSPYSEAAQLLRQLGLWSQQQEQEQEQEHQPEQGRGQGQEQDQQRQQRQAQRHASTATAAATATAAIRITKARQQLKSLIYHATTGQLLCSKRSYAIVCHVLDHWWILQQLEQELHRAMKERDQQTQIQDVYLLYIQLEELLLSSAAKKIHGGGALKRLLLQHEPALREWLQHHPAAEAMAMAMGRPTSSLSLFPSSSSSPSILPRYVRLNPFAFARPPQQRSANTTSTSENWAQQILQDMLQSSTLKCLITGQTLFVDAHVPDLLVVPPSATAALKAYETQQSQQRQQEQKQEQEQRQIGAAPLWVLQDKSSCFPALFLLCPRRYKKTKTKANVKDQDNSNGNVQDHEHDEDDDDDDEDDGADSIVVSGDVLDACAAPGNKTSHVAALLAQTTPTSSFSRNPRTVFALDRDPDRFAMLQRRMRQLVPSSSSGQLDPVAATPAAKAKHIKRIKSKEHQVARGPGHDGKANKLESDSLSPVRVVTQCKDFLQTSATDYPTVRSILLDPSCSGSGMYQRHRGDDDDGNDGNDVADRAVANDNVTSISDDRSVRSKANGNQHQQQSDRLTALASFQKKALLHAMTAFPAVQRIVYSTCSLHVQENEHVIAQCLGHDHMRQHWSVIPPPACLDQWPRRGHTVERPLNYASATGPISQLQVYDDHDNADDKHVSYLTHDEAQRMIRTCHDDDTNGFFVCCLQRRGTNINERSEVPPTITKAPAPFLSASSSSAEWLRRFLPVYQPGQFCMARQQQQPEASVHENQKKDLKLAPNAEPSNVTTPTATKTTVSVISTDKPGGKVLPKIHNHRLKKRKSTHAAATVTAGVADVTDNQDYQETAQHNKPKHKQHPKHSLKRSRTEVNDAVAAAAAAVGSPTATTAVTTANKDASTTAHETKRLKKMEWKRRQHEQKLQRLDEARRGRRKIDARSPNDS